MAAHFSKQRPVLGICLKRYTCTPSGTASKLRTQVDIPLEIALPHFVSDDSMEEEGPLFGNFKLSLQSVVCHRGVSVDSGHYISLVRGETVRRQHNPSADRNDSSEEDEEETQWLRFDDLARERVKVTDIERALKDESPYLLFYQVQPIDEDLARGDPPSYSEATDTKNEEDFLSANPSSESLVDVKKPLPANSEERKATESTASANDVKPSRISIELPSLAPNDRRGRSSMDDRRRGSIVFVEKGSDNEDAKSSFTNTSSSVAHVATAPTTPADESKTSWLGSRRGSKTSNSTPNPRSTKSRPTSQSGEGNRLSLTMSRLTGRISRDKLLNTNTGAHIADRDFAGRALEKEDAGPVVEVAEVDPTRSRASTTTPTPAILTPTASSSALDKTAMLNQNAASAPGSGTGRLEIAAPIIAERDGGRKSLEKERDRSANANAAANTNANGNSTKGAELGRAKDKGLEKEKKVGSVMRSRSRHFEKKKAKNTGERPDRECIVM